MRSPIPDYLQEVLDDCRNADGGAVADYIPELASADPDRIALALTTPDGTTYCSGDADVEFSIQSISKPFAYGIALLDSGFENVLAKIGVEPSGEAFNEISLEENSGRPRNPMINAGAIAAHSFMDGKNADERAERFRERMSMAAGRELSYDESVFTSELDTAYRNIAIGYMLRTHNILETDPDDVVRGYIRQCSLSVTTRDLSMMAATLANGGVQPVTGRRLSGDRAVRQVLSVMMTCGMYDAAGDWMTTVGIPAKSGVAGGILGVLPGQVGIAVFSPRLDSHGNSTRGVKLFERLTEDMGLHLMEVPPVGRSVLRGHSPHGAAHVFGLQGSIRFAGAEAVVRQVAEADLSGDDVIFDLSRVHGVSDVARRMFLEVVRRLTLEDRKRVILLDPDGIVDEPDAGDGIRPVVISSLDDYSPAR
ncbi:glutaminase [Hoyosella subflava]|uniref:Glutaminase n=1 Tax=Hoyosella subflava (strain DSM 45089 / JCM 17490 / NBRC 109087 / DQS3-9A1) TaxID=443218 RepID=F6ELN7_HOYSD|nr:glutaminase [Hoyosella subflava]AEF41485.1 Glutaminase [Hoyosella subflava DQS3-9A1]